MLHSISKLAGLIARKTDHRWEYGLNWEIPKGARMAITNRILALDQLHFEECGKSVDEEGSYLAVDFFRLLMADDENDRTRIKSYFFFEPKKPTQLVVNQIHVKISDTNVRTRY